MDTVIGWVWDEECVLTSKNGGGFYLHQTRIERPKKKMKKIIYTKQGLKGLNFNDLNA
jgi:hypothetical protein